MADGAMAEDEKHLVALLAVGAAAGAISFMHTQALAAAAEVTRQEAALRARRIATIRDLAAQVHNSCHDAFDQHARLDMMMQRQVAAKEESITSLRNTAKLSIDRFAIFLNETRNSYLGQKRQEILAAAEEPEEPVPMDLLLVAPIATSPQEVAVWERGAVLFVVVALCVGIVHFVRKRRRSGRVTQMATPIRRPYDLRRQPVRLVVSLDPISPHERTDCSSDNDELAAP
ncbi:hypothetical protein ACHHYP_20642 [Achlya hypogyna]|uniref:Uncharacterized protein n=1 Tax=Achlya hypogyna TaxID=1202772 RepID=A0A1V9ZG48_ACHHY|nr:hypothetical protein ACHHYP_20642 [Achlya hypogyna]